MLVVNMKEQCTLCVSVFQLSDVIYHVHYTIRVVVFITGVTERRSTVRIGSRTRGPRVNVKGGGGGGVVIR